MSAELNLKAAVSLLNETAEQTTDVKGLIRAREEARSLSKESFWAGIKVHYRIGQEIGQLNQKIDQAIQLTHEAKTTNPAVTITEEGVELNPDIVISTAYNQKGLLSLGQERWNEARSWFEQSLTLLDDPATQLLLGYAITTQGYRQDAIAAFQRVIDVYPDSEEAVEATKEITILRQIKPKKWKIALLLAIFIGFYGFDRFYLGDIRNGIIKFFTAGGFLVWWIIDIIRIATNSIRAANGFRLEK